LGRYVHFLVEQPKQKMFGTQELVTEIFSRSVRQRERFLVRVV